MSSPRDRTRSFSKLSCSGFLAAAFALLIAAAPARAQQGAVAGQVLDAGTLSPVQGAQVFVQGTQLGQLTNREGRYRITGVPAGEQMVTVQLIGYKANTQTVTVQSGAVVTADFELEQTALKLQEVVVTGVAAETPRVKLPFTVERLDAEELPVPSSNMSGILRGKAAGVSVVSAGGQPGSESDILLRGPTSIDATGRDQGPLIVIDGVIQSTSASLADMNSLDIQSIEIVKGAAAASMYGSRAQNGVIQITTKSGAEMESGTFNITLRGELGVSDLERQFPLAQNHVMRMNADQTEFVNLAGDSIDFNEGPFQEAGCGICFQDNPYPELNDNLGAFFDPGDQSSVYAAVAGSFGETNFRASAENFEETGTIRGNEGFDRRNARVNVDHHVGDEFDVSASGFVSRSFTDQVATGSAGEAAFFGILFMTPGAQMDRKTIGGQRTGTEECTGGPEDNCWFVVTPDPTVASDRTNPLFTEQANISNSEKKRTMGSVDLSWSPVNFFSLDGNFSYDRTDANGDFFVRRGTPQGEDQCCSRGFLFRSDFAQEAINASVTANFNRTWLDGDFTSRFRFRFLVEDQETNSFSADGSDLTVRGVTSLDALVDQTTFDLSSQFTEIKSQNFFAMASVDYKGKYIADGLIRRDGSSLFGPNERWNTFGRLSAAYRISQEPWFDIEGIDELKLRYSYGTAGSRPNFFQQFETFSIGGGGTLTFNTLGNKALKPEFSTEQEAGINLVLFDRLNIDASYARQVTDDQLLPVPLPAAFGFGTQWQNAGELKSETWEASIQSSIVDTRDLSWSAQVNFDRTVQEITEMDVPAFKFGPQTQTGPSAFFARVGETLGTFYGFDFVSSCSDLNVTFGISESACQANFDVNDLGHMVFVGEENTFTSGPGPDGALGTEDDLWGETVMVEGTAFEFGKPMTTDRVDPLCLENDPGATAEDCTTDFLPLGSSVPDFSINFSNTVRYKGLSVYGLLESSVGQEIYNQTAQWSNSPKTAGARFNPDGPRGGDQSGKPAELQKPVNYFVSWTYLGNAFNSFFVEDGSFLKLREVSVSYTFNRDQLSQVFGPVFDQVSLSLIGRNILTFTDYSGFDPEVGFGKATGRTGPTGAAQNTRFDAFQYPNFRTFTGAVEITF